MPKVLSMTMRKGLSALPPGIGLYSKVNEYYLSRANLLDLSSQESNLTFSRRLNYRQSRSIDVQSSIRSKALGAYLTARNDGVKLLELEFPPLLGGSAAKRATDDYTNIGNEPIPSPPPSE